MGKHIYLSKEWCTRVDTGRLRLLTISPEVTCPHDAAIKIFDFSQALNLNLHHIFVLYLRNGIWLRPVKPSADFPIEKSTFFVAGYFVNFILCQAVSFTHFVKIAYLLKH